MVTGFRGFLAAAVVLVAVLGGCWLLYQREAGQVAERQSELEVTRVKLLTRLLQGELRPVVDDLRLLVDGDGLRDYLETGRDAALQAAIRRATFISLEKPLYDQVRYLDQTGKEVFRVNQGGRVAAAAQLKNQADRAYFKQTDGLSPGMLYLSSFDLNVEGNTPELPLKPTLRFVMPVFDSHGERRGIYIINCLGDQVIQGLQQSAQLLVRRIRLLNAAGYWLKADDPRQEWGFMLPGRAEFTVARSNPTLWAQMQRDPAGQAQVEGGLITWQRLWPTDFTGVADKSVRADDAFLIVASAISAPEWTALFNRVRRLTSITAVSLSILTLICAWAFRSRRHAMRRLRDMNGQLEIRVRERTEELARSYEQVQGREQLLEQVGRLAKVGGWEVDALSGAGSWTPEVARIHDVSPEDISRKDVRLRAYTPPSRLKLEPALSAAYESGVPYDLELELVTPGGERKWVRTICHPLLENGKVQRLRGALQDITAKKESEAHVQAQLQRLHMLEHITRAIGERQDLASILQVVTRTLEEEMPLDFVCICLYEPTERELTVVAVGLKSAELAGRMSMEEQARIPIDENGLSRCVRGKLVYEPDIEGVNFPFPRRLASGALRSLVAAPLLIESRVFGVLVSARGKPNSFSSGECEFLRQLSEHVALAAHQAQLHGALQSAYEELRATQQAVMQQERLRVLGQMASGIAHDINNAISPITLYTDSLLDQEPGLSERARGYLHTIQQATTDVAETVARLREFYRQRVPESELAPLDINNIVPQIVDLTRARWESIPQQAGIVIEVSTALASGLPLVMGSKSGIREALTNLVFNAVDAMPNGGSITLRTRCQSDERVVVEVVDSGIGMDDETRRRCLEPFFTTKGERGTGLGLAMVYGVMKRHGGELEIDSAPGFGTTVRLIFEAAAGAASATTIAPPAPPMGLRILLVDDDPILLKSLREILEQDGHTTLTANGGKQGIDLFQASVTHSDAPTISVVITDLGMPHVDGRNVARSVKQASGGTPVILLTGWGERLLAEGGAPPNVDRVLSKPPRLRDLRKALAELTMATG